MIHQSGFHDVNGIPQFLSIRADAPDLPLLLYLHGGPGDAALPLVHKYNRPLERLFTVAVWEQRGAGKSYYPFSPDDPPTIQTFLDDLYDLTTYLLKQFHQDKLYLLGHSWGSVLGLKFIQQFPQLVHTHIGCGQVVDMRRGAQLQYEYALAQCKQHKKEKALERLSHIDLSYTQDTWLEDLLFVTKLVVAYKGSLYGQSSYRRFVWDFLFSSEYGLKDLINRERGSLQSIQALWPELMTVSFTDVTAFEVPIVWVEGRHDVHVSSALAEEYFQTITTPKQLHWFEHACHFPQWSQPDAFHRIMHDLVSPDLQRLP